MSPAQIAPDNSNLNAITLSKFKSPKKTGIIRCPIYTTLDQETNTEIKDLMNKEVFEDEKYLFTIENGIVYAIKNTCNLDETNKELRDYVASTWKDPQLLHDDACSTATPNKTVEYFLNDSIEKAITFVVIEKVD
ncbi:hypothetical protein BDEG_25792 [Batrachochytrium dendrobatidis JEL423]|uniref:Uncharacterized protein n=1 Tax=Batrachochytrium dendrobatidis (strain JEL423) TaxID=403673 RepID=A0A177WQC3_BATDL|nr:hypothetical protein BDEG_25792 [Batrachochytrium dendrobatidis JEL423]